MNNVPGLNLIPLQKVCMWDVQIADDCVFVFGVSNEENFADHKLCIVEKERVD